MKTPWKHMIIIYAISIVASLIVFGAIGYGLNRYQDSKLIQQAETAQKLPGFYNISPARELAISLYKTETDATGKDNLEPINRFSNLDHLAYLRYDYVSPEAINKVFLATSGCTAAQITSFTFSDGKNAVPAGQVLITYSTKSNGKIDAYFSTSISTQGVFYNASADHNGTEVFNTGYVCSLSKPLPTIK